MAITPMMINPAMSKSEENTRGFLTCTNGFDALGSVFDPILIN
jgi:hypothetical protein